MAPCTRRACRRALTLVVAGALLFITLPGSLVHAGSHTVMNTSDSGSGSLRQALADSLSGDIITFASGVVGTITLTSGALPVSIDVTIQGPGANILAIDGNNADRVISVVNSGGHARISGLTLQHGNAGAMGSGGGVSVFQGAADLTNCAITGNTSGVGSGGIDNTLGTVTLTNSTVSGNTSGGIFNEGTLTVTTSTVSGNTSTGGGFGGALRNASGSATIKASTVSGNIGLYAGGLSIVGGSVTIQNTIIAGNTLSGGGSSDIGGAVTSQGYNLIGNTTGGSGFASTDKQNVAPLLSPLRANGGPTLTQALLPGSPALDAVPAIGAGCLATDQRGISRPQGPACDIGAYELANTAYVAAGAAPGGNGTQAAPLQTVAAGIGNVASGGTVYVAANTVMVPAYNEHLVLDRNVTIIGAGHATTTLDGTNNGVVVTVNSGMTANLSGLTVRNGQSGGAGGGIASHGTLTLTDTAVTGNHAADGGGIFIDYNDSLTLVDSTVSGNSSGSSGGGIFFGGGAGVSTISGSTISGNTLSARGAGIYNAGILTLTNSTVSGNTTGNGGDGGGIYHDNGGMLTLANVTMSGNTANGGLVALGAITMQNTLIAGNTAMGGGDILGTLSNDLGHNLIGNTSGGSGFAASDVKNAAPGLDPVGVKDNGGPTPTVALLSGSPAVDAGVCVGGITSDQRGIARPQPVSGTCDIGAYEYVPVHPTVAPGTYRAGAAGQTLNLTGTGFQQATQATLDGVPLPANAGHVAPDGTTLSLTLPAHAAGIVTLVLTNPGNLASMPVPITYAAPNATPLPVQAAATVPAAPQTQQPPHPTAMGGTPVSTPLPQPMRH